MLEQIFGSIRGQIDERLSNPLAGSFLISWCLWNYKFFVILFSSESVLKTFELIEIIVFPDIKTMLIKGLLYPAITSAAYIFIYPYPAKYVYEFSRKRQREIAEIKRRIEEETPLTIAESRQIRAELARVESEHTEQLDKKDREIERLKTQLSNYESAKTNDPPKAPLKKQTTIENSQLELLRFVEKYDGKAPEKALLKESKNSQVKTEFDLGELVNKGLLERNYRSGIRDYLYTFTQAGRSCLLARSEG